MHFEGKESKVAVKTEKGWKVEVLHECLHLQDLIFLSVKKKNIE